MRHLTSRRALAVACIIASVAVAPQSHATDVGDIGGEGGSPFRSECNRSEYVLRSDVVIGFDMKSGTTLDAIVPICIAVNEAGTEWSGAAYKPTGYIGGSGGGYQQIHCAPPYAVRHFHVYAGPAGDDNLVKHVRMTCQRLGSDPYAAGATYDVVPQHIAGTVTGDQRYSCPPGEWGSGIYGNYGAFIDRLGFVCQVPY